MNTNGVNALDLKAGALESVDEESKRSRGVSTREDILVHEKTPCEILILPALAKTGDLEEEDTLIIQHAVNLLEESLEVTNTNVLGHLETSNLLVATIRDRDIAIVHAENLALLLGNTSLAHGAVAPGSLVAAESDTSNLGAKVDAGEASEGAPAAANVKEGLTLLEIDLLAHNRKLVVLELLEGLLLGDVRDDTRSVDHARTEEPAVEVITAVVVVTDLLLILGAGVHDDLRNHASQEEPDQAKSEAEARPVVAVLENLEAVAIEIDVAIEVHLEEGPHGDLILAKVFGLIGRILESQVVLDRAAGESGLLILAGGDGGRDNPEGTEEGDGGEDGKEESGLPTAADLPREVQGDTAEDGEEELVGEGVGASALSGQRGILDGGRL